MMSKKIKDEQKFTSDRRDFLKLAGIGVVASGATVATGSTQAEEVKGSGYSLTEHVKTYYELAKF